MKVKTNFVTNSSTTSFVVWGMELDYDDYRKLVSNGKKSEDDIYEDIIDIFINKLEENNIKYFISQYSDSICFGLHPTNMDDNETLLNFKDRVIESFKNIGLNNLTYNDIIWIERAERDG